MRKIAVLLSAVCLTVGAANAQNLLLNGDFNDPRWRGCTDKLEWLVMGQWLGQP